METYLGETVLATLRDPPDTQVRGLVSAIVDQQLCLKDVTWLPSQNRMEIFVIDGPSNLLDLEILPLANQNTIPPAEKIRPYVDPAILSYGKPPARKLEHKAIATSQPPTTPNVNVNVLKRTPQTTHTNLTAPTVTVIRNQSAPPQQPGDTSATLTGPFEELSLNGPFKSVEKGVNGDTGDPKPDEIQVKGKQRRRGKGRAGKDRPAEDVGQLPSGVKPNDTPERIANGRMRKSKGNGWRETPLLEEVQRPKPQLLHPQNGPGSLSRRQQKQLQRSKLEQSGWATEDATDIQEMGDFDFSGNLSKFDKRGVFDQLKQEDTTADEERLVSFNRLPPRPGTAGGKNLHYTENVLDSPKPESRAWSSGDSEADGSQAKFSSGRSSRRNMSRASVRKPPSRKGSAITTDQHMTGSGSLPESKARARWASRHTSGHTKVQRDLSTSRDTAMTALPTSAPSKPSFRFAASDLSCPCLTPLQMLELEQLAISELGMTEDLLTENASRSIAQAVTMLTSSTRNGNSNFGQGLSIVVMAGNTKSGARAIAAARQLLNHDITITVTLLAMERKADLLDVVQRQIHLYKKCGGDIIRPDRMEVDPISKEIQARPDLIIDALLGMHLSFDDLGTQDQERYFGLAKWSSHGAYVMSIDVPSGLDASSGSLTVIDGTDIVVRSDAVLSLGAPKTGLFTAMSKTENWRDLKVLVADVGINNQVWRKFGTRSKHGVEFGNEWVAKLRYHAGSE